jgi:hypothetical protein
MYVQKNSENRAVYEKTWKNMVQREKPQITTQHGAENTRFAWRIAQTRMQTHTQS